MTITDGWHSAKITAWGLSGDADRAKAQFAIGFEILDDGADKGRTITFYGGFKTDKARDYTEKQMRACGWDGSSFANADLTDAPVRIKVESETYDGKLRQKVGLISASKGGGGSFARMDDATAAEFDRLMGPPKAATKGQTAAFAAEKPSWNGQGAADDDDLGF